MSHDDFDFEPIRGLPEHLPSGERILWRGAPDWRSLARRAFHLRGLTLYFLLLLVWQAGTALGNGAALAEVAVTTGWLGGVSLAALGLLALLAWLYARTTVYTITQRRVVIRFGIAIPITVNVPFTIVEAAAVKLHRDGSGDLPLRLKLGERMSYLVMCPVFGHGISDVPSPCCAALLTPSAWRTFSPPRSSSMRTPRSGRRRATAGWRRPVQTPGRW